MARTVLGRGLSSLISPSIKSEGTIVQQLSLEEISVNENQPRKRFDQKSFDELVISVRSFGIIQPVVVRKKGSNFELIAGERRYRAAKEAELSAIPAVIRETTDEESLEIALIENLQREDLNPIEEAQAYLLLLDDGKRSQEELAKKIGLSRPAITNSVRLLGLPQSIKDLVKDGSLSAGHGRALLSIENAQKQEVLAERIIAEGLSVRQVEHLARISQLSGPAKKVWTAHTEVAKEMSKALKAKVKVKEKEGKGKITVSFKTIDELERIYRLIVSGSAD